MALTGEDNYKIVISTDSDTRGVQNTESALDRLRGSTDKGHLSFLKLSAAVAAGQAAFSLATTAASKLFSAIGDSVKAAGEAEAAQKQLEHAVLNVTKAKQEDLIATMNLADELERKGVLDGDNIKIGLAQLSTFGLSNKAVQALGGSLADLAVNQYGVNASGEQLRDTADTIAKALNGQFGVLEKSGIRFTQAQKNMIAYGNEMQKVQAINEGFAQNLKYTNDVALTTTEGKMAKLRVTLENVKEAFGSTLIEGLTPLFEKLNDFVNSEKFQYWVDEAIIKLQNFLPKAIKYVSEEVIPALINIFNEVYPVIKAVAGAFVDLIQWLGDHTYVLWGVVAVLGAIKTALLITSFIQAIGTAFSTTAMVTNTAVAGMTATIRVFAMSVAAPFTIAVITAGAILAIGSLISEYRKLQEETRKANEAMAGADRAANDYIRSLNAAVAAGRMSAVQAETNRIKFLQGQGKASGLPQYAAGTISAQSGFALVGERGPELVQFGGGEKVYNARKTGEIMSGGGGSVEISYNAPIYVQTAEAVREFFKIQEYNQLAASRGLSTVRA